MTGTNGRRPNGSRRAGWLGVALATTCMMAAYGSTSAAAADADADLIAKGKYLTTAGDCAACHTGPGQAAFSGGLKVDTPFGPLYSPNITPDKATGIGSYTDDQFYRTMHEGIANDGSYLYPVFPFPWYTKLTRDDVLAIKAYLFSLQPVNHKVDVDQLSFPFSVRASLAGWRQIYFKAETFQPDPGKSPQLNRGAYLVEGLGHCAECHTPHNIAGASETSKAYQGAMIDNWFAPNISSDMNEGIGTWSVQDLVDYLKKGVSPKGVVAGPMAQVVHESLSKLTDDDVTDIALYLKQLPGKEAYPPTQPPQAVAQKTVNASAYDNFCSSCHRPNGDGVPGVIPSLNGNGSVQANGPQDVLTVVLGGLNAHDNYPAMPAIGAGMTDEQIAQAVNYVRSSWSNKAPENAGPGDAAKYRGLMDTMLAGGKCDTPDPKIAAAVGSESSELPQVNDANLLPKVNALVAKAKGAGSQADVINSLTAMYCPVVEKAPGLTRAGKSEAIGRFAQNVYTSLVQPGGKD